MIYYIYEAIFQKIYYIFRKEKKNNFSIEFQFFSESNYKIWLMLSLVFEE